MWRGLCLEAWRVGSCRWVQGPEEVAWRSGYGRERADRSDRARPWEPALRRGCEKGPVSAQRLGGQRGCLAMRTKFWNKFCRAR